MDAPKKIWVDEVYVSGKSSLLAFQEEQFGCKEYIRADLVDGLVEALEAIISRWDAPLWKDIEPTAVCMGKGRAALAALKEEE